MYASPRLKQNKEVVLKSVKQFSIDLKYAADELKNDRDVILAAIQAEYFDPECLKLIPAKFFHDEEICNLLSKHAGIEKYIL
jgi:hypothetical protein